MAASKNDKVLVGTSFEIFKLLIVIAVINDSFKDELILSKSSCLIKGNHIGSSTQRNLLGLADKNLLLLQVKDRVVDSQVQDHG